MANLKEVRSPSGELLYYVEVEESKTKKKSSKAKAKPKSNSRFPYVDMPPKTVKGKNDKLVYPKWLYNIQRFFVRYGHHRKTLDLLSRLTVVWLVLLQRILN